MIGKVEFVDYQESPSIRVGKFLLSKGFDLASPSGVPLGSPVKTGWVGILRKDPDAKPRTYLFGLIKIEPPRMFLGTVWFDHSDYGASEQNWVFHAYGRKHVEFVWQLAEEMALTFNIKITLRLMREESQVETLPDPYYH